MHYPPELLYWQLTPQEFSEPHGNIIVKRSGKSPSEQSDCLIMYSDLFLNGNVLTFINNDIIP